MYKICLPQRRFTNNWSCLFRLMCNEVDVSLNTHQTISTMELLCVISKEFHRCKHKLRQPNIGVFIGIIFLGCTIFKKAIQRVFESVRIMMTENIWVCKCKTWKKYGARKKYARMKQNELQHLFFSFFRWNFSSKFFYVWLF